MVGAPPILEPILVGIESNVHRGYDLDFDPWPDRTPNHLQPVDAGLFSFFLGRVRCKLKKQRSMTTGHLPILYFPMLVLKGIDFTAGNIIFFQGS